jgi:hypothetical protein
MGMVPSIQLGCPIIGVPSLQFGSFLGELRLHHVHMYEGSRGEPHCSCKGQIVGSTAANRIPHTPLSLSRAPWFCPPRWQRPTQLLIPLEILYISSEEFRIFWKALGCPRTRKSNMVRTQWIVYLCPTWCFKRLINCRYRDPNRKRKKK